MPKSNGHSDSKPVREEVETIAYSIWESEGRPHGCDQDHWFRAEAQIKSNPASKPASPANPSSKDLPRRKPAQSRKR